MQTLWPEDKRATLESKRYHSGVGLPFTCSSSSPGSTLCGNFFTSLHISCGYSFLRKIHTRRLFHATHHPPPPPPPPSHVLFFASMRRFFWAALYYFRLVVNRRHLQCTEFPLVGSINYCFLMDCCKVWGLSTQNPVYFIHSLNISAYQARAALRALGLLLADGTPTVGGEKTFWAVSKIFYGNSSNSGTESRKVVPKVRN